jgi:hypothetical protein
MEVIPDDKYELECIMNIAGNEYQIGDHIKFIGPQSILHYKYGFVDDIDEKLVGLTGIIISKSDEPSYSRAKIKLDDWCAKGFKNGITQVFCDDEIVLIKTQFDVDIRRRENMSDLAKQLEFYVEYKEFCKKAEHISFSDFVAMKNYLMWSDIENRPIIDVGLYSLQDKGADLKIDVAIKE